MVNRGNWKLVKAYLKYRQEVAQLSEESLRMDECRLRHILEWADERPFQSVRSIRPTLPDYLQTSRIDGQGEELSPAYLKKVINAAHQFGQWLITHQSGYKTSLALWLDTLKAPRRPQTEDRQHEAVTLEEIRKIAAAPVHTVWEERIKAAAVFWFLSGIRVGAFVTLPIQSINLEERTVKQWPKLGVKTKFGKHSTTYLLNIPDLLKVLEDWDNKVRTNLPATGYWFAPLNSKTGEIDSEIHEIGKNRDMRARTDLKRWLAAAGLPYHSPHKFRHGFAVYGLKRAPDMAALKAVSMNLMHSNISITDGIYSILSQQDVKDQIAKLGDSNNVASGGLAEIFSQLANHPDLAAFLNLLQQNKQ